MRQAWTLLALASLLFNMGCAPSQPFTLASGFDALTHTTLTTYPGAPGRTAALRRSNADGTYAVDILGTNGHAPLVGFSSAAMVGLYPVQGDQVAVIRGSSQNCPVQYELVGINAQRIGARPFGTCGADYAFQDTTAGLFATQLNAADPEMWLFNQKGLVGPVLKSTLDAQRMASAERARAPQPRQRRFTPPQAGPRPQPSVTTESGNTETASLEAPIAPRVDASTMDDPSALAMPKPVPLMTDTFSSTTSVFKPE